MENPQNCVCFNLFGPLAGNFCHTKDGDRDGRGGNKKKQIVLPPPNRIKYNKISCIYMIISFCMQFPSFPFIIFILTYRQVPPGDVIPFRGILPGVCFSDVRGPFRTANLQNIPNNISYENCSHFWDIFSQIHFFNFIYTIRISYSKYKSIIQNTPNTPKYFRTFTQMSNKFESNTIPFYFV